MTALTVVPVQVRELIHESRHASATPDHPAPILAVDADLHGLNLLPLGKALLDQEGHDLTIGPWRANVTSRVTIQDCLDFVSRVNHNKHGWNFGAARKAAETRQGEGEDEVVGTLEGNAAETHDGKAAETLDGEAENAVLRTYGRYPIWIGKVLCEKHFLLGP